MTKPDCSLPPGSGAVTRRLGLLGGLAGAATVCLTRAGPARAAPPRTLENSTKIVMRYGFKLDGQEAIAGARERAARLGPTFEGYPGIFFKFYLIDSATPSLDAFILWSTPGYALIYLGSPEFDRQVKAFGRPRVQLALPSRADQPPPDLRTATLMAGEAAVPGVSWLDAFTGESSTLAYGERAGRQLELAYVVRGGGA